MKTRDQLLKAFCTTVDREGLMKLVNEALDSLQSAESEQAVIEYKLKKANEQIARQAKIIDGLNQALAGPSKK